MHPPKRMLMWWVRVMNRSKAEAAKNHNFSTNPSIAV
jgi:hypothetical protein